MDNHGGVQDLAEVRQEDWKLLNIKGNEQQRKVYAVLQSQHTLRCITILFRDYEDDPAYIGREVYRCFAELDDFERDGRSFVAQGSLKSSIEGTVSAGLLPMRVLPDHSVLYPITLGGSLSLIPADYTALHQMFFTFLKSIEQLLGSDHLRFRRQPLEMPLISFSNIWFLKPFSSFRGGATKVCTRTSPVVLVYKGISFSDYLAFETSAFRDHTKGIYREIEMLCKILSPHNNIMPPPTAFGTLPKPYDPQASPLICGAFYPYYAGGSLASIIEDAVSKETQFAPQLMVKWCLQLASALYHTHHVDHAWHQDLKTANILVDESNNLVLIDWEQCGANTFALAPEANGSFDLDTTAMAAGDEAPVVYVPYQGPERINNHIGAPKWNVFPQWKKECAKAVELAEVWSLGSIMWQILEHVALEHLPDIKKAYEGIEEGVIWTEMTAKVPQAWKDVVGKCRNTDPNQRMRMKELVEFWQATVSIMTS